MPKLLRLNAKEAEKLLLTAKFVLIRSQGSHRIYQKAQIKVIIPFHGGKTLHPKIVKQVIDAIETNDSSKCMF